MTRALVLVDIQNDYFPGGSMELVGMEQAAANAARLLARFRADGAPRFLIRHLSQRPAAGFFMPGTAGAEIAAPVAPDPGEAVIEKHFPNSFRATELQQRLAEAGAEELVICGAMSHMCIDATTRAAFDLGYRCTVVDDACATRDLEHRGERLAAGAVHGAFMAALGAVYARVLGTEELLATRPG